MGLAPERLGGHPREHLKECRGILHAVAYAGCNHLSEGGRILEAACWAHARRAFYDIHQANKSPIAGEALERIGALYGIESEIRGKPPDERAAERQGRARARLSSPRECPRPRLNTGHKECTPATDLGNIHTPLPASLG